MESWSDETNAEQSELTTASPSDWRTGLALTSNAEFSEQEATELTEVRAGLALALRKARHGESVLRRTGTQEFFRNKICVIGTTGICG
jgi:hypothetical protein